jgi:hypothetical protein
LQACRRIWDGVCAFFMPIPIVLPLPDFDERIIK